MFEVLKILYQLINKQEKTRVFFMFVFIFLGGVLEVLGIGVVLPYIALLMNLEEIEKYSILNHIKGVLSQFRLLNSNKNFFVIVTILIILVFWIKNVFFVFSQKFQVSLIYKLYKRFASALFNLYLNEDYQQHINKNTGVLIRNVNQLTFDLVVVFLMPFLMLVSEVFIVILLVAFLFFINPVSTTYVFCLLGVIVSLMFFTFRKKLQIAGKTVSDIQAVANRQVLQGLGSFKTTTMLNKQSFFVNHYRQAIENISKARGYFDIVQSLPRFFLETVIVTVMLSMAVFMLAFDYSNSQLILTLSVFGLAGMRLLPSMNRILNSLNAMKYSHAMVKEILSDISSIETEGQGDQKTEVEKLDFKMLEVSNISFGYNSANEIIQNVSLSITAGQSVGFVGHSGSGKSTLIDIMLGLLTMDKGNIQVNGTNITDILPSWQKIIGYIPQDIYLTDASIKENIAFGENIEDIDLVQLDKVIETAQLKELMLSLEQGVDTVIGERGVKLSGGQRQRIGIARALYHNPQVIVMDEATAALDNATEKEFMTAVNKLKGQKTLIMIAHRLSTVENCDVIHLIEHGKIVCSGGYEQLLNESTIFRNFTNQKD